MPRDRTVYQPLSGTELFSSGRHRFDRRRRWQLGCGPLAGRAGPCWVLSVSSGKASPVLRSVLARPRATRSELYLWLAVKVGPLQAREFLQMVGPIESFYRQYFAARPDLEPVIENRWLQAPCPVAP